MKFKNITILSILIFVNFAKAGTDLIFKAGFEFVSRLNDTGIIWAGEYPSGNNMDCTSTTIASPQDCNTGRDVTHNDSTDGHAGFSFTKLDASGMPIANQGDDYATTQWSCVQDNVTGLVWEVKTITAGIHNKDNTYVWGGITAIGLGHQDAEGTYFNDWDDLVDGSNTESLCGFDDWRVPTVDELSGLAILDTFYPAIDIGYFPNTSGSEFWTSSSLADNEGFAWIVGFHSGYDYYDVRDDRNRVRLVRSLR